MKPGALTSTAAGAPAAAPSRVNDLIVFTKVRLNSLVVATTAAGYYMAAPDSFDPIAMAVACAGTALVASGAAGLNQVAERDLDRLMERTRMRPVAEGRMSPAEGRAIGAALSLSGLLMLAIGATTIATIVAATTLLVYLFVYTPLKRRTSFATVVGAVPGALPPLIGWTAAGGAIGSVAPWTLFFIMFLWQLPHFLAIAWMCRLDYARAGMPMLPVVDPRGGMTGRQAALWAATIVPASLLPYLIGLTSPVYAVGALVLGMAQLAIAVRFALQRSDANARALFYASITYLPLLLLLMTTSRH